VGAYVFLWYNHDLPRFSLGLAIGHSMQTPPLLSSSLPKPSLRVLCRGDNHHAVHPCSPRPSTPICHQEAILHMAHQCSSQCILERSHSWTALGSTPLCSSQATMPVHPQRRVRPASDVALMAMRADWAAFGCAAQRSLCCLRNTARNDSQQ